MAIPVETSEFAERVRCIRDALGISQAEFGRRLGVDGQTVSAWERGRSRPRGQRRWEFVEQALAAMAVAPMVAETKGIYGALPVPRVIEIRLRVHPETGNIIVAEGQMKGGEP